MMIVVFWGFLLRLGDSRLSSTPSGVICCLDYDTDMSEEIEVLVYGILSGISKAITQFAGDDVSQKSGVVII